MIIKNGYINSNRCQCNNCINCPKRGNCIAYLTHLVENIEKEQVQEKSLNITDIENVIEKYATIQNDILIKYIMSIKQELNDEINKNTQVLQKSVKNTTEQLLCVFKQECELINNSLKEVKKELEFIEEEIDLDMDLDEKESFKDIAVIKDQKDDSQINLQPLPNQSVFKEKKGLFGRTKWVQEKQQL